MDLSSETQQNMLARMRRIEGQARGVQRMIAEGRDCLDILTQLASLRSAAYSVSVALTQHYAVQCLHDVGQQGLSLDQTQVSDDAMRGLVDVLLRTPHWLPKGWRVVEIFGLNTDVAVPVLILIGWIVVMRFVLPRLGISTWMGEACDAGSPREEKDQAPD